MANTRELRRRIKSVTSTAQITKAMQMVAATKMRKAQIQAFSGRPYNLTLNQAITLLLPRVESSMHQLLQANNADSAGILLLSTDKSLCGALNTNVFRAIQNFKPEVKKLLFYSVGKKGRNFIVRTGKDLVADFENLEKVQFKQASQIAKLVVDAYLKEEIKEFYIVYPDFISTLRQEPKIVKLLPLDPNSLKVELGNLMGKSEDSNKISKKDDVEQMNEFLFEPNLAILLDYVLNHYIEVKIYQAMLETKASEHSARMIAMQNATNNAKDLVSDLQLAYNQTRQEGITKELLEITSALAALD